MKPNKFELKEDVFGCVFGWDLVGRDYNDNKHCVFELGIDPGTYQDTVSMVHISRLVYSQPLISNPSMNDVGWGSTKTRPHLVGGAPPRAAGVPIHPSSVTPTARETGAFRAHHFPCATTLIIWAPTTTNSRILSSHPCERPLSSFIFRPTISHISGLCRPRPLS